MAWAASVAEIGLGSSTWTRRSAGESCRKRWVANELKSRYRRRIAGQDSRGALYKPRISHGLGHGIRMWRMDGRLSTLKTRKERGYARKSDSHAARLWATCCRRISWKPSLG